MKVTVVPAQVTTIEDRVAGNLSFMQLVLFAMPVFGGSLLYAALPPSMGAALYKLVLICLIAVFCLTMAIRIKGKIVLLWLIILTRYRSRPRQYVFNKNTSAQREPHMAVATVAKSVATPAAAPSRVAPLPKLAPHEIATVYATINDPQARMRIDTTKKGALHVQLEKTQD